MFITGPSATLMPFPRNSAPMACPRRRSSVRFHVDATVIPAGNAVTRLTVRTPRGASWRHRPGQLRLLSGTERAGMFPMHRPWKIPDPVEIPTFCSSVRPDTNAWARECADAHAGSKSGISSEPGGGGDCGEVEGKVPGIGGADGTGNEEKVYEEMGRVISAVLKCVSVHVHLCWAMCRTDWSP